MCYIQSLLCHVSAAGLAIFKLIDESENTPLLECLYHRLSVCDPPTGNKKGLKSNKMGRDCVSSSQR